MNCYLRSKHLQDAGGNGEIVKEFSKLSENEHESDIMINKIIDAFQLNKFIIDDDIFEHIDWEDINYGE